MQQYTINASHCSVFGMDVHARSVTVRGLDRSTGETKTRRFGDCPAPSEIASWMREGFAGPHYAAYESGCTGFHLCRELRSLGVDCDVVAVSSIARSPDDRQRKSDRRDAGRMLSELLSPEPSHATVWTPDPECEAVRDLARARADAVAAAKRAKQQTAALLLRHGRVWNEKTKSGNLKKAWGREFWAWLGAVELEGAAAQEALALCKRTVRECDARVAEAGRLCERFAQEPRWKPFVDALSLLKGVDVQTALLLAAEMGDFSRFRNGRSVSKWLGTVPREDSSGERVSRGRITKAGNSHCRTALIEGLAAISRWTGAPKAPKAGCEVAPEVAALCAKANRRIAGRYRHLRAEAGLCANKARVAVASEMARWAWAVGLAVQGGAA